MDQSIADPLNDTTALLDESNWIPDVRKNLLSDLATPQKALPSGSELVPGQNHMKVFLRVRPFTSTEEEQKESQGCIEIVTDTCMIAKAPKDSNTFKNSQHGCAKQTHRFTFSQIFRPECTQKTFFDETVLGVVKDFIDGQNCLIFTYGVTNSGKTYTIQGNPKDGGILPRSLDVVFNSILDRYSNDLSLKPRMFGDVVRLTPSQVEREQNVKDKVFKMACTDEPDMTMLLGDSDMSRMTVNSTMSEDSLMMPAPPSRAGSSIGEKRDSAITEDGEFASAVMADIESRVREEATVSIESQAQMRFSVWVSFVEVYNEQIFDLLEPLPKKKGAKRSVLQLREDKNGVPYVKGTKEIHVTTADEAYKVLTIGRQNLQMADTKLNHNSSRSHCIFTVKILRTVDVNSPHVARVSQLSFCDLAGAERSSKTMSQGDRMKEAGNINTSLLSLGRCIKILRHNQMHRDHPQIVPFRDSKLTRLFQSFFCGKGKAAMIVNVNQCASMFDETLHALKYSAIAKQVVVVQEAPKEKPKLQAVRSHRLVSLALQEKPSRATIGWATPGTLARLNALEEEAMNVPIPDEDDDVFEDREQELLEIIEQMKQELIDEKKKAMAMEMRIRAEVCDEMAKQIVEIENTYSNMMKEEKILAEERMEKRIEIYMHSVKKSHKRKRIFEDEDEGSVETVPGVFLQEEQAKVKELREQVDHLHAELTEAKEQLSSIMKERDALQQQHTEISFQMANMRSSQGSVEEGDLAHAHAEVVSRLQTQIQELKEELGDKDKENTELNEMITEAGETFQGNEAKIEELQSMLTDYENKFKLQEESIQELQKVAEDSRSAMEDANSRLIAKQSAISDMQSQLEATKECLECQAAVVRQADLVGKLADAETDLQARLHECERLRAELTSRDQVTAGLQEDVKRTRLSLDRRAVEVTSLRDLMAQGQSSEQSKINKLLEQLQAAEEREKQSAAMLADREAKLEKYTTTVDEYKVALGDHEGFVAELNKQIREKSESLVTKEEALTAAQETATQLKMQVERTVQELDELKACYEQESKASQSSVAELQAQLVDLKNTVSEKSQQSTTASEKVSMLEQTLAAANEALREKSLEVSRLQEEVTAAQGSHSEVESAQELTATLRCNLERLQAELKAHQECEGTISELQKQLDDYIFRVNDQAVQLGELQDAAKADTSIKELAELKQKMADVEARLAAERGQARAAQDERDALLQDKAVEIERLKSQVSELTKETEKLMEGASETSAAKLEVEKLKQQLTELQSRPAPSVSDTSVLTEEDHAALRQRVRELENMANEAEYKAQMGTRQMRREKSAVERRLKEVETELEEAYQRSKGLEERIRDLRQQQASVTKKEEEEEEEEEEKDSELEAKYVELESEVSRLQAELAQSQQQAQEGQQQLEASQQHCSRLEAASQQHEAQVAEKTEAQLALEAQHAAAVGKLQEQLSAVQSQLSAARHSQEEQHVAQEGAQQHAAQLAAMTEQQTALEQQVAGLQQERENLKKAERGLQKKLHDTEENLTRCTHTIEALERKTQSFTEQLSARQEELDAVRAQLSEQQSVVSQSQVEASKLQASLECKVADVTRLEERLSAMEKESGKNSEQSTSLKTEAQQLRAAKQQLETQMKELQSKLDASHSNINDQEASVKTLKTCLEEKESQLTSLHNQLEQYKEVQQRVTELEAELGAAQKELSDLSKVHTETKGDLSNREASIESYNKQIELLKEEIIILNQQVAKLSGSESALRDTVTALRSELETKDTRLGRMEDELGKKNNAAAEQKALQEELEKSIERETKLRRQLQEASQRLEEQNVRVNIAEDKLKVSSEMSDKYQKEVKTTRQEVQSLKEEMNTVRQQMLDARDCERSHKEAVSSKQAELSRLSEELERKEARLKQRNATVKDLMAQMEQERASYEIALKDAKTNERMIESLKAAMDEQEATMETQDKVLQSREEHIQQMQTDHEEQVNRYEAMMSSSRDQSSQMKELQARCRELQAKVDSTAQAKRQERDNMDEAHRELESKVREHRRRAERAEHDRNRFEQDLKDTNEELRGLERKLKEREAEVSSLQAQQSKLVVATRTAEEAARTNTDSHNKLDLLKIKFQKLEEQNRELEKTNQQRQQELDEFSVKKKQEMDKWREDRDALVGQLQKILKEKDAKLTALSSASTVKSEQPQLQAEVAQLRQELSDKDETIAELSRHLDEGNTTRPRRGGRGRLGSDTSDVLRKEVENIYRQLETERMGHREELNRAVRAKDEIIADLKHSNQELLCNLSGNQSSLPIVDVKVESHPPGAPSMEGEEEKPSNRRRTTKGSARKRKTSEAESENSLPDDTPNRKRSSQAGSKTRRTKRTAQMQVSFSENDPNFMAIQEEDMVDLDQPQLTTPSHPRVKRTALADTLNTSGNGDPERGPTFISPEKPSTGRKKKHRLRSTNPEQFAQSPAVNNENSTSKQDVHKTVTRSLRSRKKTSQV